MTRCEDCGTELKEGDAFCAHCGQKVLVEEAAPPPAAPEAAPPHAAPLQIGRLFRTGWNSFKQYPWGFIGYTLVYIALVIVCSLFSTIGQIAFYIPFFPLVGGFMVVSAKVLQGEPRHFSDFFAGFRFFVPLCLMGLATTFLVTLGMLLLVIPGIYLGVSYVFAPFFILDQRAGFWAAMEMSRKTVKGRWFQIFGLILLLGLVCIGGALLLGLGLLVAIPLCFTVLTAAYGELVGFKSMQFYKEEAEAAAPEVAAPGAAAIAAAATETAAAPPVGIAEKGLGRTRDWTPAIILIGFLVVALGAGWYFLKIYRPAGPQQTATKPAVTPKEAASEKTAPPSTGAPKTAAPEKTVAQPAAPIKEAAPTLTAKDYFSAAYSTKDFQQKIAFYTKAIELDPKYVVAYNNRGIAYYEKKDYANALSDYNKAIELDPKYAIAYNNRGKLYFDKKDYDRAISDYTMAIALKPDYHNAYNNRGNLYYEKKEYDNALHDYSMVISLKPDYHYAYSNRGNTYLKKNDYEQAIADFNKAIAIKPDYHVAYLNRGIAYFDQNKYQLALEDFNKAISLKPDYANAYYRRAILRNHTGDYEQARQDYEKAKSLNPNLPPLAIKAGEVKAPQADLKDDGKD